jgi:hypothetical protein
MTSQFAHRNRNATEQIAECEWRAAAASVRALVPAVFSERTETAQVRQHPIAILFGQRLIELRG